MYKTDFDLFRCSLQGFGHHCQFLLVWQMWLISENKYKFLRFISNLAKVFKDDIVLSYFLLCVNSFLTLCLLFFLFLVELLRNAKLISV